jgi:hypothetical protein
MTRWKTLVKKMKDKVIVISKNNSSNNDKINNKIDNTKTLEACALHANTFEGSIVGNSKFSLALSTG